MSARITLVLIVLVAAAIPTGAALLEQNAPAQTYDIHIVQPRPAAAKADGVIETDAILQLSFEMNGQVRELYAAEGDTVQAGDVIAVLENERERIDVENAKVQLAMRENQRDDLLNVDEDEIRLAEARISSAMNSYGFINNQVTPEDIQAAELRLQAAEQSVAASRQARIRGGGNMFDEGITLLDAEIGEATFDAEIARLQLEHMRDVNDPQLGAAAVQIEQAKAELALVLAGPNEFQVNDANLAVEAAEQALRQAEIAFGRTVLVSPEDGIITNIQIEPGQRIERNDSVMQLVPDVPLYATVEVDEIDYRQLAIGLEAIVTLDALPGVNLPATVTRIAPEGEEVNGVVVYETDVELNNPDPRIRVGMSATAYFGVTPDETVLVIPARFITNGDTVTIAQPDGTLTTTRITTGASTEAGVEVTNGLQPGDALVITE